MLKKVGAMSDSLDFEGLKKAVLPAVHALCLGTTSGGMVGAVHAVHAVHADGTAAAAARGTATLPVCGAAAGGGTGRCMQQLGPASAPPACCR
jgi:hypothetical protein